MSKMFFLIEIYKDRYLTCCHRIGFTLWDGESDSVTDSLLRGYFTEEYLRDPNMKSLMMDSFRTNKAIVERTGNRLMFPFGYASIYFSIMPICINEYYSWEELEWNH